MPNLVLNTLPEGDLATLRPHLEEVPLQQGGVLQEPDQPIRFVHFVLDGLVSLLTVMNDRSVVESGIAGCEGVVGVEALLGAQESPTRNIVQVPGTALRIPSDTLQQALPKLPLLERCIHRYTLMNLAVAYQLAACNRLHTLDQRCAFWLLQVRDLTASDRYRFTHRFLAYMLGVRRASVTGVLGGFVSGGLVHHQRGRLTIVNQMGLEERACECRPKVHGQLERYVQTLRSLGDGG